jgi:hypothetical protein
MNYEAGMTSKDHSDPERTKTAIKVYKIWLEFYWAAQDSVDQIIEKPRVTAQGTLLKTRNIRLRNKS